MTAGHRSLEAPDAPCTVGLRVPLGEVSLTLDRQEEDAAAPIRRGASRLYITYGPVAVWGLLDDTVLGLIPVNAADNVLHIVLSAAGILAALASPLDRPLRTTTSSATTEPRGEPGARGS